MSDVDSTGMPADEVLRLVDYLDGTGAVYQINGGWAVDALVGRQTRPHADVDLFLDSEVVPALLSWLGARGYVLAIDWLPTRAELVRGAHRVDVHPMRLVGDGDGIQHGLGAETFAHPAAARTTGRIHGRAVVVANARRLEELRQGYIPREIDVHDLQLLRHLS